MRKFQFEAAPFFLAFVLGPMFERTFRQSLISSHGDLLIFFKRPLSVIFMALAFLVIASNFVNLKSKWAKKRREAAPYGQRLSAGVLLVFAALFIMQAIHYGIGSPRNPEPGFFPAMLEVSVCLDPGALDQRGLLQEGPTEGKKSLDGSKMA